MFPIEKEFRKINKRIFVASHSKEIRKYLDALGFIIGKKGSDMKKGDVLLFTSCAYKMFFRLVDKYKEPYDIVSLGYIVDCMSAGQRSTKRRVVEYPSPEPYVVHYHTFQRLVSFFFFL